MSFLRPVSDDSVELTESNQRLKRARDLGDLSSVDVLRALSVSHLLRSSFLGLMSTS